MNKVILMGRLTAAPELKQTQSGISCTRFTIAVLRRFKDRDGNYPTDFINCAAWRNTAEFISRYFNKGNMIAVVGSIQTRTWTDSDRNKRSATEVIAEEAYFTGEKKETANQSFDESEFREFEGEEDLPF